MKKVRHVGLILDGTRRWAKENGVSVNESGLILIKKMDEVLQWVKELPDFGYEIEYFSVYAYSLENLERDKEYKKQLFEAMDWGIDNLLKNHVKYFKVIFGGKKEFIEERYLKKFEKIEEMTKYNDVTLNIAICYDGKEEILDAFKKLFREEFNIPVQRLDLSDIGEYLYFDDVQMDMLIRTGFEKRLSGFMPWYTGYAELIFLDCYSIDLTKEIFMGCFEEYFYRNRRFGK